ncbi:hypothetical protein CDL15_Pgr018992 [Punica granatum]|uniref:Uncharacterized protein n=1 Tax=Punica granatum TaxID=22663 RepID=A0A218XKM2_PUNGR|nr:hypothetical protein CDL15_Pgr018992 [Punica granatum]
MLVVPRSWVWCLLLALLSISSAVNSRAMGARHPRLKVRAQPAVQTWKIPPEVVGDESVPTMKREVPSCPDPLHNR